MISRVVTVPNGVTWPAKTSQPRFSAENRLGKFWSAWTRLPADTPKADQRMHMDHFDKAEEARIAENRPLAEYHYRAAESFMPPQSNLAFDIYYGMAGVLHHQSRYKEAKRYYLKARETNNARPHPDKSWNPILDENLGMLYLHQVDKEKGGSSRQTRLLQKAHKLLNRAWQYIRHADPAEYIPSCEPAETAYGLGRVASQRGDCDKAIRFLKYSVRNAVILKPVDQRTQLRVMGELAEAYYERYSRHAKMVDFFEGQAVFRQMEREARQLLDEKTLSPVTFRSSLRLLAELAEKFGDYDGSRSWKQQAQWASLKKGGPRGPKGQED